ncbi:hypothetical protein [Cryobacterium glucosi]|uniref:Terminase small subunit n=1 Tax=Cryobacterium glucosi TaxID=1259175 RepID=A0ABY2IRP6_9MICO|nr:hypothetical protein [Cryobacterium glucosi]TFC23374.1 hypothetical protein E3O46_02065 [Cryobacterium glucosi]
MTDPRYRPRDLSAEPLSFGRASLVAWRLADSPQSKALLIAAQLQHEYAIRIRAGIERTGSGLKAYASEAGMSYDRAGKMLRGEIVMRLEDIATADVILGGVSELARAAGRSDAAVISNGGGVGGNASGN